MFYTRLSQLCSFGVSGELIGFFRLGYSFGTEMR